MTCCGNKEFPTWHIICRSLPYTILLAYWIAALPTWGPMSILRSKWCLCLVHFFFFIWKLFSLFKFYKREKEREHVLLRVFLYLQCNIIDFSYFFAPNSFWSVLLLFPFNLFCHYICWSAVDLTFVIILKTFKLMFFKKCST